MMTTSTPQAANPWPNRRVLVTGATGIVGSWLVKALLQRGAFVVSFVLDDDPQSELIRSGDLLRTAVIRGDLRDLLSIERAINLHEVDTVVHLGAQTIVGVAHRFPLTTFEANIRGTYHLLEVCRLHRDLVRRIVVASSDKAYGTQATLPYTEEMPLLGRHPYEVSKSCVDLLTQSYYHTYRLPLTIARFGNVYGGGDLNFSRIVPGTIRSFLRGERPIIRSDGTFRRDYIYVKDVADAYLLLADRAADEGVCGEAFNFSPQKPRTVLEIVEALSRQLNCGHLPPDIRNDARGEIRDQFLCARKARERLQWAPSYDLDAALAETIDWYRNYLGVSVP